ncbi:ferritin-like domain-containing protein [Geodermatophilus sp. YIM 151500]|uniref:ferritin-like domain-containing protein n=1 Tax=Geodermatophilus sp. YIM 151500 TaxID=2984531 RepID=UPI0021E4BB7F|nr:ferritin-like domain-containing protein [Geodermatophilus sp. YIM 151500]MCV2488185.1 ferritin-like domain-containing protein [Geodermatophilus sp. YIM 151500]
MTDNAKLINQLRALLLLTQTEEQIARIRIAQARTDAVRRELNQNADNAADRSKAIADQLRALGGVPDVVTPAVGRLGALVKATLEQAEPIEEALLQDLQLEHQLLDRATYLKVLADTAGQAKVKALAERLIGAHEATVEWLTVVLAEEALGGPAALQATPFQKVAGGATRVVSAPVRFVANTVNRAVDTVQHTAESVGDEAREEARGLAGRAAAYGAALREVLTAGRSASLRRAEQVARREGDVAAADAAKAAREELGDVSADELPIKGYDSLSVNDAVKEIKQLKTAHDINVVIRYEETHKKRANVASAAQTQLAALAKEAVGVTSS